MNGLCPCGQDSSRRLCVSLCVTKESPLRRSLKVLSLPRGRYRDDLNDLVREITERTESSGEVFRIADGHFDPGLLSTRKFNQQQQVPTRRFVPDGAGGGTFVDFKTAQTAPTPVKPPTTPSKLALDRLADSRIGEPSASASRNAEIVRSRLTSLREQGTSLEETVASLRRRVAELEEQAKFRWTAYQTGKSPCFRWDYVMGSSPSVIHSLTGMPNAAFADAFHDLLNAEHMLDDLVIAHATDIRCAMAEDGVGGVAAPTGAAAAPAGIAAAPGGAAAHVVAAASSGGDAGPTTPMTGKRRRGTPTVLFVEKSSRPGGRKRTLSTHDALFLVLFILRVGCPYAFAAWAFAVSVATVSQTFAAYIVAMDHFLQKEFPPLELGRAQLLTPAHLAEALGGADIATFICDGTEIRQLKASDLQVQRDVSPCP